MNDKTTNSTEEVKEFTEKTRQEVRIWDWIGRVFPLIALFAVTLTHFIELHTLRDVLLALNATIFIAICVIWWYWALRKIISSVNYIQKAHDKFLEVTSELKKLRKEIRQDDSNR
jgi:hypothetical protein